VSPIIAKLDDDFVTLMLGKRLPYQWSVLTQEPLWHADYAWVKLRADG
jgi:hypothetical protein